MNSEFRGRDNVDKKLFVIPAKAGIQPSPKRNLDSLLAGMTHTTQESGPLVASANKDLRSSLLAPETNHLDLLVILALVTLDGM